MPTRPPQLGNDWFAVAAADIAGQIDQLPYEDAQDEALHLMETAVPNDPYAMLQILETTGVAYQPVDTGILDKETNVIDVLGAAIWMELFTRVELLLQRQSDGS